MALFYYALCVLCLHFTAVNCIRFQRNGTGSNLKDGNIRSTGVDLESCCASGKALAERTGSCAAPHDPDRRCRARRSTCCMRAVETATCERGKRLARRGEPCETLEASVVTFKDCCDACTLGMQSNSCIPPIDRGFIWDEATWNKTFRECCPPQSDQYDYTVTCEQGKSLARQGGPCATLERKLVNFEVCCEACMMGLQSDSCIPPIDRGGFTYELHYWDKSFKDCCPSQKHGPPEPLQNCTLTNQSFSSLSLSCEVGEDGGSRQSFHLEIFSMHREQLLANVTAADAPSFVVRGLPSGESFLVVVYASNAKGRSSSVVLRASTLISAERRTGDQDDDEDEDDDDEDLAERRGTKYASETATCEQGKSVARQGGPCVSLEAKLANFEVCCEACIMGLQSDSCIPPLDRGGFTYEPYFFDKSFKDCCPSQKHGRADRCQTDNPCSHKCEDLGEVEVLCSCDPGYKIDLDRRTCIDVDECVEGNHTCSPLNETCVNTQGGFECQQKIECPPGHAFNPQLSTCEIDLESCCASGETLAHRQGTCTGKYEADRSCVAKRRKCCMRALRNATCEQGKRLARQGGPCETLEARLETFQDCCEACTLGLQSDSCIPPIDKGFPWDEATWDKAFMDCCPPQGLVDRCQTDNPCSHKCEDLGEVEVSCSCDPGYKIALDQRTCIDVDECVEGNHTCSPLNETCVNTQGGFECQQKIECPPGYAFNPQSSTCEVDFESCCASGKALAYRRGRCDGQYEADRSCVAKRTRCCMNALRNASCEEGKRLARQGGHCETLEAKLETFHDCCDACTMGLQSDSCIPPIDRDFTWSPSTWDEAFRDCCPPQERADRCQTDNPCSHKCEDLGEVEVFCSCDPGYKIAFDRRTCIDVDECAEGNHTCDPLKVICVNTLGGFECQQKIECVAGYAYNPQSSFCEVDLEFCCTSGETMAKRRGTCNGPHDTSPPCMDKRRTCCMSALRALRNASCEEGKLTARQGKPCENLEARVETFHDCCNACTMGMQSDSCIPPIDKGFPWYEATWDEAFRDCCPPQKLVDRCQTDNPCSHKCEDLGGVEVSCSCNPGYKIALDERTCIDVDECVEGNHTCDPLKVICVNTQGGFECQQKVGCAPGYVLNPRRTTCEVDLESCCARGETLAKRRGNCNGPHDHDRRCMAKRRTCCIRALRNATCEQGKRAARQGNSCETLEARLDTFQDCCEACTLGLQSDSCIPPIDRDFTLDEATWDKAFKDCCRLPKDSSH